MHHQPAGPQHAVRFGEHTRDAGTWHLVQEHRREHDIEARIGERELLGIHLMQLQRAALRACARERIAQAGRRDVDAVHLGRGILVLPRAGVVPHGAAEIEDALRAELRLLLAQPARHGLADVIEVLAHQPER